MLIKNKISTSAFANLIDFEFLNSQGITVAQSEKNPWQFFLYHPDLNGHVVWYPTTGSIVYRTTASAIPMEDSEDAAQFVFNRINHKKV